MIGARCEMQGAGRREKIGFEITDLRRIETG